MTSHPLFRFGRTPLPEALQADVYVVQDDEIPAWLTVDGGGLEQPVAIRLSRVPPGRYAITGLTMASDPPIPITSSTLRAIRPAALLEQLVDFLNSGHGLTGGDAVDWHLEGGVTLATAASSPIAASAPRKRGVPPTDEELHRFAEVYLDQLQRRPHRAMTTAANLTFISRTTAHRWAQLCRERGYLPPKEER